jgi:uncharacterized protein YggE
MVFKIFSTALFSIFLCTSIAQAGHQDSTVTVSGAGEVRVKPDTASISVGSVATALTPVQAMAEASTNMGKIVETARDAGIEDRDLRTQTISLLPVYERTNGNRGQRPKNSGYRAQQRLRVTVRKIDGLGEVLDTLVKAGANDVGGIGFSISKRAELVDEARRKAVSQARHAASILASEADMRLGSALKIEEQSSSPVRFNEARMMRASSISVPVSSGDIQVSVRIRMVFYLLDAWVRNS